MTFGDRIRNLRIEKGWSQFYVSEKLNISYPALSRYERGTFEPKSLSTITAFAKLYDVTTDYLLGNSKYKNIDEQVIDKYYNTLKNKLEKTLSYMEDNSIQSLYMIPLYSKLPNFKNIFENLEGYIPVNPEAYGMSDPKKYFYIYMSTTRINNQQLQESYALVKKQNKVNDEDLVLIETSNKEVLFTKWKKINEQFALLEPIEKMSINNEPTVLDLSKTKYKVVGKIIGNFTKIKEIK